MGCPRALAIGLSYVQVGKHGISIYTTYISVDLAHHEIFRAKVGKGGIKVVSCDTQYLLFYMQSLKSQEFKHAVTKIIRTPPLLDLGCIDFNDIHYCKTLHIRGIKIGLFFNPFSFLFKF